MIPYRTFPSLDLGPVTLRTFGLFVGIGVLVGSWLFVRHGRRHGLDAERLTTSSWWILIAGFVGPRLLFVVSHPSQFVERPWAVVAVWEGGLEFSGGFLLAVIVVVLWLRRHRDVPGLVLADGMVLGLAVGLAVGRTGCYSIGEHLGGSTTFPLGVHYLGGPTREGPIPVGAHIHNTALYDVLLVPVILLLFRSRDRVPAGWITVIFLGWYGVQRFVTDFFRAHDREVLGLTGAQYVCISSSVSV